MLKLCLLAVLFLRSSCISASPIEYGTPKGPGNIYGLKVYYQLVTIDPLNQEMILDVEKSYNSDPHYLQRFLNYAESCLGYFLKRPYYQNVENLYAMLTIVARQEIVPQTTDDVFLTNAWHAYEAWNGRFTPGILRHFLLIFPHVKRIRLITRSGRRVIVTSSGRLELQEFKATGIDVSTPRVFNQRF